MTVSLTLSKEPAHGKGLCLLSPRHTRSEKSTLVQMMAKPKLYIARLAAFLLAIIIVTHIALARRFYLFRSDTGKQWAALAAWLELRERFSYEPPTPTASRPITETVRSASFRVAPASDLESTGAR